MPSILVHRSDRIFLVTLMIGKEFDQTALGEVVGHLHFDQARDSEASSSELDEHRSWLTFRSAQPS